MLPSSASRPTSVRSPSTGVWSSFQSPVSNTRPAALSSTTAIESGTEWATRTNSTRKGPISTWPSSGLASFSSTAWSSPCSSSLDCASPSVNLVPQTWGTRTSLSRNGSAPT